MPPSELTFFTISQFFLLISSLFNNLGKLASTIFGVIFYITTRGLYSDLTKADKAIKFIPFDLV